MNVISHLPPKGEKSPSRSDEQMEGMVKDHPYSQLRVVRDEGEGDFSSLPLLEMTSLLKIIARSYCYVSPELKRRTAIFTMGSGKPI